MKMKTEPGITWIPSSEMERRLNTIPLPKKLKSRFSKIVVSWQYHSGTEWTVTRLKAFKDCLLHSYSEGRLVQKPEWFRTTRAGNLSGVFGSLWRVAMEDAQRLKAVLFLVNIYTGCYRTKVTPALLEEIKSSIQQEPVRIPKRGYRKVGLSDVFKAFKRLPKVSRAARSCGLPEPLTMNPPGKEGHIERLLEDVSAITGSRLYKPEQQKMLLDAALGAENVLDHWSFPLVVGKVGITHEPGLKTRYFAFPNVVLQRAVEPLKELLLHALGRYPWDCTLDQRRADNKIINRLSEGKHVHSIDMSKATDSFPWEFQYEVGKYLTLTGTLSRTSLDLVDQIVKFGHWRLPDGSLVKWTKGQPLGLGPSFPLFAISHGILLFILNEYKWDEMFYILGDDVVILDDLLAIKYREVLKNWKVDVSETKSFTSSSIAQFAGVNHHKTGMFHVPKWRPFTRANILDLEAWWYPGLTKGLPDHSIILRVLELPEPYGLGRNPKGLTLGQRLDPKTVEALLEREDRRVTKAHACVTRVNLSRLQDLIGKVKEKPASIWNPVTPYSINRMLADKAISNSIVVSGKTRRSTDRPLPWTLLTMMDGTDVPGYPRLRRKQGKVDPYTLGSLGSWKQLFGSVDSAKLSE